MRALAESDPAPPETRRRLRFLRELAIFEGLAEGALRPLADMLTERRATSEEIIFRHDDAADALFLVKQGAVALFRDEVGKPLQLLGRYSAGDYFGELGLFDGGERRGTARATELCLLWVLPREPLLAFLEGQPQLALKLHMAAARRHSENVAAVLGVGPRDEVRIRLDRQISMRLPDGNVRLVTLENLSNGGLSLSNAPAGWQPRLEVRFTLDLPGEPLDVTGRISWRSGTVLGIAFTETSADHEDRIQEALRRLLATQNE